jgi:hypothetical protein
LETCFMSPNSCICIVSIFNIWEKTCYLCLSEPD